MTTKPSIILFLGTALCAAGFVGAAPLADTQQNNGLMQGLERANERGAERMIRLFDGNKDGKVGRKEMDNSLGARFAAATHHQAGMSLEQYLAARAAEFRPSNEAMFLRLDWNGDGKLSLAEYTAPQHIRFVELDRAGQGFVFCGVTDSSQRSGRAGLAGFCRENDLDMDGKVTRAELDQALAKRFAAAAGRGQTLDRKQFVASEEQRYLPLNVRTFRRLDQDGDGLLSIREYAATETALFVRLDKNGNGVLEANELRPRNQRMARNEGQAY